MVCFCLLFRRLCFFFSFFWTFFHSSLSPTVQIGSIWPPLEITVLNTWEVPALNTAILLTSGASITLAHYALLKNDREEVIKGFLITLFLAILFTSFQLMEYFGASYHISDSVYGSVFFYFNGIPRYSCIYRYLFYFSLLFSLLSLSFHTKSSFWISGSFLVLAFCGCCLDFFILYGLSMG